MGELMLQGTHIYFLPLWTITLMLSILWLNYRCKLRGFLNTTPVSVSDKKQYIATAVAILSLAVSYIMFGSTVVIFLMSLGA